MFTATYKLHGLAARAHQGQKQHGYTHTGNIKDNSDIVHALLRSVEEDVAAI